MFFRIVLITISSIAWLSSDICAAPYDVLGIPPRTQKQIRTSQPLDVEAGEDVFQSILDRSIMEDVPGVMMAIHGPDGVIWSGASGIANRETGDPMTPNLLSRMGSVTKTFVSALILQLSDENHFQLDDPIEQWLPGAIANGENITIRHLMNMTSGLFNYTEDDEFVEIMLSESERHWSPTELIAEAMSHEPYFLPGEGWRYSNTNYVLLGILAEQIAGQSVADQLRTRFTEPLGLTDTVFGSNTTFAGPHAHGYADYDDDGVLDEHTYYDASLAGAAGDGVSTVSDLATWARALYGGTVLSDQSHADIYNFISLQGLFPAGMNGSYGLGVFQLEYDASLLGIPLTAVGHDGGIPGYVTLMFYLPKHDIAVAIMINAQTESADSYGIFEETARCLLNAPSFVSEWNYLD